MRFLCLFPPRCAVMMLWLLPLAPGPARADVVSRDVETWQQLMNDAAKALKNNRLAQAITSCEQAQKLATEFGPADTHGSRSQVLRAEIYMWEKKNELAEQTFQEAVASCERAVGANHPEMVHPLASQANFYYYVAPRYERVAVLFERILGIVEKAPEHDDHAVIMWSRNLGMIHQQMGQFSRAEPCFARALALAQTAATEWVSHELLNSAAFYRSWARPAQAEALARQAVVQREAALAAAPGNVDAKLDVSVALGELSADYLAGDKLPAAEQTARRSLALAESFMTPDQPDLTPRLTGLATVLRKRGDREAAAALYRRALTVTEKNLGPDHRETATLLSDYGGLLREMKKEAEAKAVEDRAEAIRRRLAAL